MATRTEELLQELIEQQKLTNQLLYIGLGAQNQYAEVTMRRVLAEQPLSQNYGVPSVVDDNKGMRSTILE